MSLLGTLLGNTADVVGTALHLPGIGLSEYLAGGNTVNTGRINETGLTNINQNAPVSTSKTTGTNKNSGGSNVNASSNVTGGGGVNYYTGGSTGVQAPAYDPKVISQYDQSIGLVNDALGRLGSQLDIARGNIGRQYNTSINELNSGKAQNKNSYDTSSTQNQQSYRTNKNAINDQTSAGLQSLLRMLGAYGAVGSDLGVASGAVQDQATQQRAGAGQNFAQNQQGLDTNWNNYLSEWSNSKRKADDWKQQQLQNAEQQSLSTRQDLLGQLAGFQGQRSAAMGGDYAGGAADALAKAKGLSGRIDNLGRINPTYNGNTPVYNAPELSSYLTPEAAQASMGGGGSTAANSNLALLLGLDQRKKQNGLL